MQYRMSGKRIGMQSAIFAASLVLCLTAASHAVYDVPDNCRTGSGTYSGELTGVFSYKTCIKDGVEVLDLKFEGDFAHEAVYPETPAIVFSRRAPSDTGEINIQSGAGRRSVTITSQFGACGITGTWQLKSGNTVAFSGSFSATGTGPGQYCVISDNPGSAIGGLCGLFGSGLMLTAAPLVALGALSRIVRRR